MPAGLFLFSSGGVLSDLRMVYNGSNGIGSAWDDRYHSIAISSNAISRLLTTLCLALPLTPNPHNYQNGEEAGGFGGGEFSHDAIAVKSTISILLFISGTDIPK